MWGDILPVMSLMLSLKGEVCYQHLGCFSNDPPWAGTPQRLIHRLPWSPEEINTRFLLYTRDNPNTYQEINALEPQTISESHFQTNRKSRFIIHGFLDDGEKIWLSDMCKTMLQVEDVNCICVDWGSGSRAFYSQAANNIRVVGAEVAYLINILQDKFDYFPSNIHLIGHSLGAHVAGEAGKRRSGIFRITGLDPAQPYFQDTPAEIRLDPSDALFVDVIHTDSSSTASRLGFGGYGISQTVGHLDFYPNGGKHMPGCEKENVILNGDLDDVMEVVADLTSCSHIRSLKYYTESILHPDGFIGYPGSSYKEFLAGNGFPCPSTGCPMMGHYAEKYSGGSSANQTFYLNTGAVQNYSRWRCQVTVHIVGTEEIKGSLDVSLQGSSGISMDHTIYRGIITPDISYSAFIDAEIGAGNIHNLTFQWRSDWPNIYRLELGASTVTIQYGKDGAMYSFCDGATTRENHHRTLHLCPSPT
ncbi:pancreatic lipase-related protein 2-like [Mantella aurantiaca]